MHNWHLNRTGQQAPSLQQRYNCIRQHIRQCQQHTALLPLLVVRTHTVTLRAAAEAAAQAWVGAALPRQHSSSSNSCRQRHSLLVVAVLLQQVASDPQGWPRAAAAGWVVLPAWAG